MLRRDFLKKTTCTLGFGIFNSISRASSLAHDFDLILADAFIFDGTGKDGFFGNIGILGDRIISIGTLKDARPYRLINVESRAVAPGFIDLHSHSDDEYLLDPRTEGKIKQGVTTEIVGQDGSSVAPLSLEMRQNLNLSYQNGYGISVDWSDFRGYFRRLNKQGISVNIGTMIGQGTLREYVVGRENRPATRSETAQMKRLVQQALRAGALGVSTGLEYTPGGFASSEELIEICKPMRRSGGIYATHMRNEADYVVEAVDEAIAVARGAEVPLHIAHIKCMGKRNWHKTKDIFDKIKQSRQRGVSVTMDRYPYTAYNTSLSSLFPIWARSGSRTDFVRRLQNPEILPQIRQETIDKVKMIGSWKAVMITAVESLQNKHLEGKRVSEVAGVGYEEAFEFVRRLIIKESGGVDMCGFAMSEENTAGILAHRHCIVASDASARSTTGILSHSSPHPRTFGTFPRVLGKYVREMSLLPLSEAIRKMTRLPATRLGLKHRGLIREGYFADIVVFNPDTVKDNATFEQPHQYPTGINYVLVNGAVIIEGNRHTGATTGRILKRGNNAQNH